MSDKLKKTNIQIEFQDEIENHRAGPGKCVDHFEPVSDWTIWTLPDGKVEYISPSCQDFTGYSAEEFAKRPDLWMEIIDPQDHLAWIQHLEHSEKPSQTLIFRIRKKDGDIRWIEHHCRPVLSVTNTFLGCRGNNWDITGQVEAWAELKQREEKYRNLVENAMDVIWTMDLDGNFDYISPACLEQTGYTPDEYKTINLRQHLTDKSYRLAMETLTVEMNTPIEMRSKSVLLEFRHYHKNGSIIDIEVMVSGIFNTDGILTGLQGATRTITDRKNVETVLRSSEQRYRALVEAAPVGIYQTDENGKCTYVNPRWCEMAGISPEQAKGDGWKAGIEPEDLQMIQKNWRPIVQANGKWGLEYRFKNNKKTTWVYGVGNPISDENGQIEGYVGINMDINERRKTEAANQRHLTELKWFTSIVNSSPVVVFFRSVDNKDQIDYVSANIIQFGYTADQIIAGDISWFEIVHPDDQERLEIELQQYIQDGIDDFSQEYRIITAQGEERWIEDRNLLVRNSEGKVTHVQGVMIAVSKQKKRQKP